MVVYAKQPRTFQIPTPVGNYAPDRAITIKKNEVKHIFFVAETKGSMSSMDLSAIERAKIDCAEKLFNTISTSNVKYHQGGNFPRFDRWHECDSIILYAINLIHIILLHNY